MYRVRRVRTFLIIAAVCAGLYHFENYTFMALHEYPLKALIQSVLSCPRNWIEYTLVVALTS